LGLKTRFQGSPKLPYYNRQTFSWHLEAPVSLLWIKGWRARKLDLRVDLQDTGSFVTFPSFPFREMESELLKGILSLQPTVLFKNKSYLDVMGFLDTRLCQKKGNRFVIRGAPGIGKTITAWAHSCRCCCEDHSLVIVHAFFFQGVFRGAVCLRGGKITQGCWWESADSPSLDISAVGTYLRQQFGADARLFVDGVTAQDIRFLQKLPCWIAVASSVVRFSGDATQDNEPLFCDVNSWEEAEYVTALKGDHGVLSRAVLEDEGRPFSVDEDVAEWVKWKYYFCGGSARLMFHLTLEQCLQKIEDSFRPLTDLNSLLDVGMDQQGSVVGTLCQSFGGKFFPLSRYVMDRVRSSTLPKHRFISEALCRGKAIGGGSFLGWIHEFSMLVQLSETSKRNATPLSFAMKSLDDGGSATLDLRVTAESRFERIEGVALDLEASGVLLVPESHSNGCFDAAIVYFKCPPNDERPVLITLQATVAATHDCKSWYITNLLRSLWRGQNESEMSKRFRVWHVFVLKDTKQFESFKCSDLAPFVGVRNEWDIDVRMWKTLLPAIDDTLQYT